MNARRRSGFVAQLRVTGDDRSQAAILDELRRVILDGAAAPGTPIPIGAVAHIFGVSPIPVRESLRTLIGEELVTQRPNHGYAVAQLTATEFAEMYIVRETLETAALRVAVHKATDAERAEAEAVHSRLEAATRADDPVAYHRLSRVFHLSLTRPSNMLRLLHMLEAAWNITEPVQPMVHVPSDARTGLHSDHRQMLNAFLSGDAPALLAAVEKHNCHLNEVIASLPTGTGLLADEDIHFPQ